MLLAGAVTRAPHHQYLLQQADHHHHPWFFPTSVVAHLNKKIKIQVYFLYRSREIICVGVLLCYRYIGNNEKLRNQCKL
jgi:hypothetical protein